MLMLPDEKQMQTVLLQRFDEADNHCHTQGRLWYLQAHDVAVELANDYGKSTAQTAGVLARLSPGIRWQTNIVAAENVLDGDSHIPSYERNTKIARQIALGHFGEDYETIAEGAFPITAPKISNFYRCIYNPLDEEAVTVDRWMVRSVVSEEYTGKGKLSQREYDRIAKSIRQAAKKVGLLPSQFQAIIWESLRRGQ